MIEADYGENADCFRELYLKFNQTVYKYVLVSLNFNESLTDDCLQDIYTTVYTKMDEVMKHPNPGGFLIVTARNFIKKYKNSIGNQIKHTVALDVGMEDKLIYEENFEAFLDEEINIGKLKQEFINMLSERDIFLYTMFYENKYSITKISEILHISEGNVKVRLYRLRLTIKTLVKKCFSEWA